MARCPLAPLDRTEENALCRVAAGFVTVDSLPTELVSRIGMLGLVESRYGRLELTDLKHRHADVAFERELAAHAATGDNIVAFATLFPRHHLH